ncbi:STOREKEEPER protein-like [Vigna unguiculata]|uniref:Glabrous enhancer-binding protein-like DBD domain-containing protein n=1 Tax=Vigna unguiculata TaxID=3917 RepID=A0A4D6LY43_VIGUN|nr:STOREKEEPER protein-like [Vigna unguiculata]XP_027924743.1 STOREKEEPER protein-like [Vigna unguiculata]XP_027924745.1 STOREKEEPER protein-like [Vigna unguiculata]QCD92803.1 hypothetical protein DEO72_LG5g872 [Vigna unguiculata]QCD92804.1 hypothetical protein DEO72_LG5g873 [Vigna unguiculata]
MAKKPKQRPPPVENPPTASSSESEEDDDRRHSSQPHAAPPPTPAPAAQVSSSEEEDDSSEEEDQDEKQRSTLPASANAPSIPHPKSSSSESESESDTDSQPAQVKPKSKPKPADQPQPQPKVQAQRSSTPVKPGSKRPADVTEPKRAKKKATEAPSPSFANEGTEEDGKKAGGQAKVLFQRIWSEEDELGILKGILEFISKTGQEPYRYADAFHNFIKKSLHVEVSSHQLKEKIRRMKKRFLTHAAREKNGKEPRLFKPHHKTLFEFSKKIWGEWPNGLVEKSKPLAKYVTKTPKKESATTGVAKPNAKAPSQPSPSLLALPAPENSDSGDVSLLYSNISCFKELDEDEMKRGLTLIGESKRKDLERRWKVLQYSEMELLANRSLLIGEQIKLVSEALQSSNN